MVEIWHSHVWLIWQPRVIGFTQTGSLKDAPGPVPLLIYIWCFTIGQKEEELIHDSISSTYLSVLFYSNHQLRSGRPDLPFPCVQTEIWGLNTHLDGVRKELLIWRIQWRVPFPTNVQTESSEGLNNTHTQAFVDHKKAVDILAHWGHFGLFLLLKGEGATIAKLP